jgi:predicted transcriptional regulator
MLKTTRTIKVSSENCRKLARLGTLDDSSNSLIEGLSGIYYDRQKKTTTAAATGNRRAGTGEPPNNTDMNNIVAEGKRFMDDDSKTVSDDVIISSYLPRCHTDRCLKCSRRHYVSEVCKK